jgi:DNA polymerase I-like protein with 3'-5' exonuclease and polymerase domains
MILEKLKKEFDHLVVFDFEFRQDIRHKGEKPDPICAVYKDIITQKTFKAYGLSLKVIPFDPKKSLFICYNAVAEASCLKVLGCKIPEYWWDCFVENKKLYQGRVSDAKGSWSMLTAANRYGIETMTEDRKKWEIEQILTNPEHPIESILEYCEKDVIATEKLFIEQLKDIEKHFDNKGPLEIIQHGLFHGRSMAAMAEIECNGMPIDNKLYDEINNNFPLIKEKIINEFNAKYPVYENGKFSMKKFKEFIDSLGLLQQWPRTPSGALSITEKNIYNYAQSYPAINEFYFVKEFVESQKLKGFVVGPDGRARTSLNMFGIKTGRTNQSTALYPFNAAKPMRNILCPAPNHAYIYADYKAQEIAIAAYLSKDETLIEDYKTGDVYIETAIH